MGIKINDIYSRLINRGAVTRLANAMENGSSKNIKFARVSKEWIDFINLNREIAGQKPLSDRQIKAYIGALNKLGNHVGRNKYFKSYREAAQAAYDLVMNSDIEVFAGNIKEKRKDSKNTIVAGRTSQGGTIKSIAIADAPDGGTSLKDITPRRNAEIKNLRKYTEDLNNNNLVGGRKSPTSASNDKSWPGMRSFDARQAVNASIVTQKSKKV